MRFDVKTTALTVALLWGVGAMFGTGLANLIASGYGQAFLDAMASLYPGYMATPSFGQVIVGALYGLLDGAVTGAVFAWLYNYCAGVVGKSD